MLCGWMSTSILSAGTSNSQRASFSSHPDYDLYVATDAEARRIAREILSKGKS